MIPFRVGALKLTNPWSSGRHWQFFLQAMKQENGASVSVSVFSEDS